MRWKLTAFLTCSLILTPFTSAFAATEKVLYSFTGGDDGSQPFAGVVLDAAGNLYGTAQAGGAHGAGVVFELSPSQSGWTETVLYTFTGGTDGSLPIGGVVLDGAGNLYGTAANGGDPNCHCGTVFKLTPSGGGWTFTILHSFTGFKDGASPAGILTLAGSVLLGTTVGGSQGCGNAGCGTVFKLSTSGGSDFVIPFNGSNGFQPWGA